MTEHVIMDVLRNQDAKKLDGDRHPPFTISEAMFFGRLYGVTYSGMTTAEMQMQSTLVAAPTYSGMMVQTRVCHVVGERGAQRNEPLDEVIVLRASGMGIFDTFVLPVIMGRLDVEMQDGEDFWDLVDDMVGEILRAQLSQTTPNVPGAGPFISQDERRNVYDTVAFYLNAVRKRLGEGYVVTGLLNRPKESFGAITISKETSRDLFD